MNAAPRPMRLAAVEERATWGGNRLQRILGHPLDSPTVSRLIESCVQESDPAWQVNWFDTNRDSPVMHCRSGIALHVLWTASTAGSEVGAGVDPLDEATLARFTAHPGDTIGIPGSIPFAIGKGALAIAICSSPIEPGWPHTPPGGSVQPPTHGLNLFRRFNRRTVCLATPELLLDRWKLTQPLELDLAVDRSHLLINLVEPVGLVWPGGSDLAPRASSWLIPAGTDAVTLVPDNLGYVLLASVPDLMRDVIAPLRSAGYDNASIAEIGVPRRLLAGEG